MYLTDGKLVLKKKPTDERELGQWKVTAKTIVEVLAPHAAAAFRLDRFVLFNI